jgi:uncharacterized C2H2 Zn-finger protein
MKIAVKEISVCIYMDIEKGFFNNKEKLWVCQKCNKKFKDKYDMSRHINKKNPCVKTSTIPKFECYRCLKEFDIKRDYQKHLERKTDCSLDINAPVNATYQTTKINWEAEYKVLEAKLKFQEDLNEEQEKLFQKLRASQEERIASILKMNAENIEVYVEYLLDPKKEIKLHHVAHYIFNILLKRQEKEYKLRYVYWFLLDRTSKSFLSSIVTYIQDLENDQDMFIKFTEEYITRLDEMKKKQTTLYGKFIITYIDKIKTMVQLLKKDEDENLPLF